MKTKYPKKIKLTTSCPWGYEQIEGTREAIANDEMMETLGEGISRLENEDSLRQVVEFFKAQGHPISRPTLVKLWEEAIPNSKVRAKQKRKVKKQTRKKVIKKDSKVLTKAQLEAKKKSLAVAAERRRITAANKRLEAMLADKDKADGKVQEINLFNTKRIVEVPQHMSEEEQEEFERKPIFEANPGPQFDFLEATEKEVLFGGAAGGGKAQPIYSLVATPKGFIPMGQINVGDEVCTPDGGYAKVLQVHPQGSQDIYEITFQDGSTVECTLDHLWYCKPVRDGKNRWKVRTTKELLKSPRTFVVPLGITEFEARDLPLDPYVLGCILGDGGITTDSISFTSSDPFIVNELKKSVQVNKRSGKYQYGIVGINPILRELKLIGENSHTKFIPWDYCYSSYEHRLSLIQGLMDTDGYVSLDGKVNFTSVSEVMLNQMAELIRSVGGTAKKMKKGHTLYIRHPNSNLLFRLPRKKNRCHQKVINNRIVSISKRGHYEAKCITIDSEEQLYITEHYIPTHNSYGLLADPIRYFENPHFSGLLVRKTNDELRELVQKSKILYPQIFPKGSPNECKFSEKSSEWRFKSGAKLWLSYLDDEKDLLRYQGQAYTWIGFDELTHWHTPGPWDYLRSRLRTAKGSGLEKHLFMRATTNPGGPGHMWVKEMFIDPAPPNTAFWATDIENGTILTDPETEKPLHERRFIPSRLIDNPYLWEDGQYRSNLLSLPEAQRLKLLEGDWNIVEGAAFSEFRTSIHVVKPFEIPTDWTRFRCMDWGYNAPSAVLWIAVDPSDGQLVVYREMYGNGMDAEEWAGHIRFAQRNEKVLYGVLDSSCWNKKGEGPGIAERMIMNGVTWRPSDRSPGSRVARKNRLHELLKVNEEYDRPGIVFFENCRNLIADLPMIPNDPKGTEDIDPKFPKDHTYDALGYGIMSRPKPHTPFWIGQSTTPSVHVSDQVFGY